MSPASNLRPLVSSSSPDRNIQLICPPIDTSQAPQDSPLERYRQEQLDDYYRDVRRKAYGYPGLLPAEITAMQTENSFVESSVVKEHQVEASTVTLQGAAPKRKLGFLDLPGEIRNTIYRYALNWPTPINGVDTQIPAIQLLITSNLVHDEASSIFYEENTFIFGLQIDWARLPEIVLVGFPKIPIWPAPRYHEFLSTLHIQFQFKSGDPSDTSAPEILQNSMHSMRAAYDACWDELGK
jgi:hypothetical protein